MSVTTAYIAVIRDGFKVDSAGVVEPVIRVTVAAPPVGS